MAQNPVNYEFASPGQPSPDQFYDGLNYATFNGTKQKTKQIPVASQNDYNDLAKIVNRQIQQPQSQAVSRKNSRSEIDSIDLNEEPKKVKKVIKKVVRRKKKQDSEALIPDISPDAISIP